MTINSVLCLACSSSLPPKSTETIFTTQCCNQPICHACIQANPRLARYNPCLACLGGVGVVGAGRSASSSRVKQLAAPSRNVDGAVRDEDTFAIGDDDDDDEDAELPQYSLEPPAAPAESSPIVETSPAPPSQYFIKPNDTLQGIALRFKVTGQTLCRLNNLPPSTLTTTPHLLHTRTSLVLPPSALAKLHASDAAPSPAEARALEVSRAGKRLQTLTKETDWHVARAYVALAEDPDESAQFALKQKELGAKATAAATSLEAVAADRYLDDLDWEAEQLRAGRAPRIEPYPVATAPLPGKNGKSIASGKGTKTLTGWRY